jgi:UDP-N-acetylmuramoyl-tripeptide--D-alanyl-D-alanine ligase
MARLFYGAPEEMRGAHRATSAELEAVVLDEVRFGDVLMVKGSNGSRMSHIVSAVKRKFGAVTNSVE